MKVPGSIEIGGFLDSARISRIQISVFILCGLIALLDGFDTQAIAFAVPLMAAQWGTPLSGFGLVFGAGLMGICVGSLALAPLADRFGRRTVIVISTAVFGALALLTVSCDSIASVALVRFLTGLGLGAAMPNLIAMVAEYAPARKRALLVTASFCGFPLGGALGGIVAAVLVPTMGWPTIFLIGGAVPLMCVPLLLICLPESPRFLCLRGDQDSRIAVILNRISPNTHFPPGQPFTMAEVRVEKASETPLRTLFAGGRAIFTLLLWGVFFCSLLVMYFLFSWLPSVLQRSGLPLVVAINAAVILNLGGILGGLVIGRQVDRWGPLKLLSMTYALGALAIAGIGVNHDSAPIVLTFAFLSGMFIIGSQFAMNALAASAYPTAARSTGVGWALGVGRIGSVVGPLLGGLLVNGSVSHGGLFIWAAIPAVLSAAFLLLLWRRRDAAGTVTFAHLG